VSYLLNGHPDSFYGSGALTLASALSYPKRLGGAAVFSGWVPFNASFLERVQEGKQVLSSISEKFFHLLFFI
jgi:predicted esterase